jgi:dipeptidyl aminopeptidase/acylaminoacyl peptidase
MRLRTSLLCLLFAASHAPAQDNLFTAHHVSRLKFVTAAAISPDGTQIAYTLGVSRNIPKEKDGLAWIELHVVDVHGTSTPYLTGPVNVDAVAWTPDGKGISFLAKRDKDEFRSLHVIPVRGGEARKVLSHSADIFSYSWGPDGKQVAFLASEPATKERKLREDQGFSQEIYEEDHRPVRVWLATLGDDKPARPLKLNGSASELVWSPTARWDSLPGRPTHSASP